MARNLHKLGENVVKCSSRSPRIVPETFQEAVVRTALQVVKRRLEDIDSQLLGDTDEAKQVDFTVGRREWEVLAAADFKKPGENPPCEAVLKRSCLE